MKRPFLFLVPSALALVSGGVVACSTETREEREAAYNSCLEATAASIRAEARTPMGPFSAALVETDPGSAAAAMRESLLTDMRTSVQNARAQTIARVRCEALRPPPEGGLYADAAAAPSSGSGSRSDTGGGASQVSGTNNQVAGVDEADFVKNDTKYIYVANGSSFRIVEAWPATSAHEIAKVDVPGTARKLFVEGDRALVYSAVPRQATATGDSYSYYAPSYGQGECTYGQSGCVPSGDGTETTLSIFDITDRATPRLVRRIHSSSSFVAARRIGTAVHTVLAQPQLGVGFQSYPSGVGSKSTEAEINAAFDALVAKNEQTLAKVDVGNVVPTFDDSAGQASNLQLFRASMPDGKAVTSVLSLDLAHPALKVASVIGRAGWVYASADALYMAVPHQQISGWGWYEGRSEKELSTVHKFSIGTSPFATTYRGSGFVKGRVLNQLAMDEKDGRLRLATTTGHLPSPDAHNSLSVVEDVGGKLEVVGLLDNIAPGEDIRSARFDGDRGYVVTFKKTDPLFVFDLADPRAPKTLGELKIPGFSTYMHMMDATHLLTIGYDAADQGDFAYFTGVLLQIFDVSNPADPKLAHKHVIGTRGSSSEALTNHLAFNYFAPKSLLSLPMTVCEGGSTSGSYGTTMTFSGLMVFDTTVQGGFSLRGQVAHPTSTSSSASSYYDSTGCSNWWTNATSEVKRSIIMDDYVFSVSERRIKVNALGALSEDVADLSIQ